jgi:hypothetical protein
VEKIHCGTMLIHTNALAPCILCRSEKRKLYHLTILPDVRDMANVPFLHWHLSFGLDYRIDAIISSRDCQLYLQELLVVPDCTNKIYNSTQRYHNYSVLRTSIHFWFRIPLWEYGSDIFFVHGLIRLASKIHWNYMHI